jgi:AcrR family transcriptional regulator
MKQLFRRPKMAIAPDNNADTAVHKGVQGRLLDAAEELFCQHGFDATTIRDIATAAQCNVASVNYYFGSKEKLYAEVWRRHLLLMRDTRIASIETIMSQNYGKPRLEDLLTSYANAFVEPMVGQNRGRRFIKLMAREMIDQHLPHNLFFDEMIIPVMTAFQKALITTCPGLDESKAQLVILSIVGQLMHIVHATTMFEQVDNPQLPKLDLTEAVNHVVRFSAAGIRAFAQEKAQ